MLGLYPSIDNECGLLDMHFRISREKDRDMVKSIICQQFEDAEGSTKGWSSEQNNCTIWLYLLDTKYSRLVDLCSCHTPQTKGSIGFIGSIMEFDLPRKRNGRTLKHRLLLNNFYNSQ